MKHKVALIILYDHEKNFLLQHRTRDAAVLPDYWAFFGGGIKEGETPEDGACREAYEELNYKLKAPRFFIEQDFRIDAVEGHMYVFIEAFDGNKSVLKLQEGQGWGWYKASEIDKLKMIDHDRQLIGLIDRYLVEKIDANYGKRFNPDC